MQKKILIVEDNEKNRLLFADIMKHYGYDVIEAENGEQGTRVAGEQRPDLILLDMQMPVMDGFTALKLLRSDAKTRDIKIIAVTSFAMKGDRERILSAGADDYMAKPVDTRKLYEMVKRLV